MSLFREHDKLDATQGGSQVVGEFLHWLQSERQVTLAVYHGDELVPMGKAIVDILGDYYDVSPNMLENEKRAMLAILQGQGLMSVVSVQ